MRFSYPNGSTPLEGFTIEQGIGIGGFGEVYLATSSIGKRVALKKIQRNLDIELRGVRQCINLKHVNLISLWDIRTDEHGESWVVMEYVPGPSLRDVVEANPNGLGDEEAKKWFVSIASGVAYLHQQDIVHRDLKPGNVFLDQETQVVKIGDYGLSKFLNTSRRSGQTESVGTFHYMAPEIGRGVYGKEIDIYALGIILFEILTGDVPFDGESTQEIIMKHLTDDPKLDRVPAGFRKPIRIALQKDPELRYHNVPEMMADMPWPDIAENCQKIVAMQTIGPIVGPNSDRNSDRNLGRNVGPTVQSQARSPRTSFDPHEATHDHLASLSQSNASLSAPDLIEGEDVQIIEPPADIVFGPLQDLSQSGHHSTSDKHSTEKNNHARDPLGSRTKPIQTSTSQLPPPISQSASGQPSTPISLPGYPESQTGYSKTGSINPVSVHSADSLSYEEPIARSVKSWLSSLSEWWSGSQISTPIKVVIVVLCAITFLLNSAWILPVAVVLGLVYLAYYGVRTWWLDDGLSVPKDRKPGKREIKRRVLEEARNRLKLRPARQRLAELCFSLLIAILACSVFSLLGLALGANQLNPGSKETWLNYSWMMGTSAFASCLVLIVSKFWEDRPDEPTMRRFSMLAIGLCVGLFSYVLANSLSVNLVDSSPYGEISRPDSKLVVKGMPILPAVLIFFGALFGILRWWLQTDPVRSTRLSIVTVSFCLVWACLISYMLELRMMPNCILAVVVSISIQLASPWKSLDEIRSIVLAEK